jgi:3-methyladenine DNA glycosylase AlkD
MRSHRELSAKEFAALLTALIKAPSSTEKCMAGIIMDYATPEQRQFNVKLFDGWLDHLIGWAEVDAVCTGKYTIYEVLLQWQKWSVLLKRFSKSKNIQKRRASLVIFCSPLRHSDDVRLVEAALQNITQLAHEKDVLVTKAISWVLRSMVKHHKKMVADYIKENTSILPAIALRETLTVLKTGKKTK